jgi:hypothetical protein
MLQVRYRQCRATRAPRDLPERPSLDHLKHEAKALRVAFDFGADFVRTPGADYPAVVRLLIEHGARFAGDEHRAADPDVRAALERAGLV